MKITLKRIFKIIFLATLVFFALACATLLVLNLYDLSKEFNSLVGHYKLDTVRTKFNGYEKNRYLYTQLELELKYVQTFVFNMSVPFIKDSIGTWYQQNDGGEGNWYEMRSYNDNNSRQGFNQFAPLTKEITGYDGVYLNSTTPKPNQEHVPKIYFIKK